MLKGLSLKQTKNSHGNYRSCLGMRTSQTLQLGSDRTEVIKLAVSSLAPALDMGCYRLLAWGDHFRQLDVMLGLQRQMTLFLPRYVTVILELGSGDSESEAGGCPRAAKFHVCKRLFKPVHLWSHFTALEQMAATHHCTLSGRSINSYLSCSAFFCHVKSYATGIHCPKQYSAAPCSHACVIINNVECSLAEGEFCTSSRLFTDL